jgi:sugar/nucleoside kinase (ribokinase family)
MVPATTVPGVMASIGKELRMRRGVAALGFCSWDRFIVTERYPGPGEYEIVREQLEQAGGTTGNTCAALARLGVPAMLASRVGDDTEGVALIASLRDEGCNVEHIRSRSGERSDSSVIVVSGPAGNRDRTIYWIPGAKPTSGDELPVDEMLEHEWVLIDVDDARLRSFFLDLPAHRSPRTKLVGTMTFLLEASPDDAWQHLLRHDAVVGNTRELLFVTQQASLDAAIARVQAELRFSACRALYVSQGAAGAMAITARGVETIPAFQVDVIDTTGAGDAFAAGCIWALLDRCNDTEVLRRGTAVGSLACRGLGARTALPTFEEVDGLLAVGASPP